MGNYTQICSIETGNLTLCRIFSITDNKDNKKVFEDSDMEYVYFLPNASLTLRVVDYVENMAFLKGASLTILHQVNGWVVRIKTPYVLSPMDDTNVKAFLSELGTPFHVAVRLEMVFWSLDIGDSPIEVMRNYRVAIVSHGTPKSNAIESFRQEFIRGLGYRPETLA
ncbi:hypothetical protein [Geminocystis herdmanii]